MGAILWHTATTSSWIMLVPMMLLLLAICFGKEAFRADYPSDIRACMPPASSREKRAGIFWGGLFLLSLLAGMTLSTWQFISNGSGGFGAAYCAALLAGVVFIVYDLVIVDWLVICALRLPWAVVSGTEHCAGWSDYGFHFRILLQWKVLITNLALPIIPAAIAYGVSVII
ncbi:hypothetical protein [Corynebacterium freiburgense]|uniref:hypothetical protein n=1 Tax=Corynebacterium freiburgense TaxID=556548 RepID=UPI0006850410|nr:hypothetical protein [Corynebacterium freiburgense]WJZ02484.1 hypothetical protein CFREI_05965 [Corynebacterium freiburgense]